MTYLKQILFLGITLLFAQCQFSKQESDDPTFPDVEPRSIAEIKESGVLRALVNYSGTSYFLYRGEPMGFEYELLERYADHLGVELELVVSNDIDSLLYDLNTGKADLVAHGFSITQYRKQYADFTDYLYLTHQVLVQRKPENWRKMHWSKVKSELVDDAIELIGDSVSVRAGSSYAQRLENLSEEIGGDIHIDTVSGQLSTDRIIKKVVEGEIEYTVADDNIAKINASYYPSLNVEVPVSFSQRVSWAVPQEADSLREHINQWVSDMKSEATYYVIFNKYFKNKRRFRQRVQSPFYSENKGKISRYDSLIQNYADSLQWDWRLLASLVYQESRFRPNVKSWAGAKGLMQLMPATAKSLGVTNRRDPQQNLRGGATYLRQLYEKYDDIADTVQRQKFAMASYNCGYYHVLDARKLAEKRGLDPNRWDDNVAEMVLALSYPKNYNLPFIKYGYVRGIEPYVYVKQIFRRYKHYKQFTQEQETAEETFSS